MSRQECMREDICAHVRRPKVSLSFVPHALTISYAETVSVTGLEFAKQARWIPSKSRGILLPVSLAEVAQAQHTFLCWC